MRYRIPDDVLHRVVQTDTVILNAATNAYVSLNGTAGRIWELFGAGQSADEVRASMVDEFDVDPDVVEADVADTLQSLLRRGLLEPSP
jgi:Coenzyme PQQ synthesis protein D (PqqD)